VVDVDVNGEAARLRSVMAGVHRVLAHLAGRVPDDFLADARQALADGDLIYLPDALSERIASDRLGMPAADIEALANAQRFFTGGSTPALLDWIPVEQLPPPTCRFAATGPVLRDEHGNPLPDVLDYAAVGMVRLQPDAVALWRAFRTDDAPDATPHHVYLVELAPGGEPWSAAGDLQRSLADFGSGPPRVEVFTPDEEPGPYQRAARAVAEQLWTGGSDAAVTDAHPPAAPPGRQVVDRAVDAARAGDLDALRRLIDWQLTGAPRVARGLAELDPDERGPVAAEALAVLAVAGQSPDTVARPLGQLAELLRSGRRVELPAEPERAEWLELLQVPYVPAAGLTAAQLADLALLRERAAALGNIYLVVGEAVTPLAWSPESDRLVVVFG
jgi:hypothetical protein